MPYLQLFSLKLVTKLRRRPFVVTWNEVWGREYWDQYLGRFFGAIAARIERTAMTLPDEILAVSVGTAERLRQYVDDNVSIKVIPNAVDLQLIERVRPAALQEPLEILFVGRLLKHKGVDLLVEAIKMVHSERPLRALIVGTGPERSNLESQVADANLNHVVQFVADIHDQVEVLALMKAAKIFVFPSTREGFGIAPLEALACGTRVITTSHIENQARHLVARSDRGYVVDPTSEALAVAIKTALRDADEGERPRGTVDSGIRLECGSRVIPRHAHHLDGGQHQVRSASRPAFGALLMSWTSIGSTTKATNRPDIEAGCPCDRAERDARMYPDMVSKNRSRLPRGVHRTMRVRA